MRMLITYAVCIPLAVLVGYMLTNPLDYGTLGFLGLVIMLIISPVFIKWHYPILVFALGSPIVLFFLKTSPPFSQVMVLLSLGIAVIERTLSGGGRRFISVPSITWPLIFTLGVVLFTAQLTGGIGFHQLGGDGDGGVIGGGKKYLAIFIGIATFYALASRGIPPEKRRLYMALFFLPPMLTVISDLFPYLPSPLNYINLLIPPSSYNMNSNTVADIGTTLKRFSGLAILANALLTYMLVRYGLRNIFIGGFGWKTILLILLALLSLAGGFRSNLINLIMLLTFLFFLEGLYRTRLMPIVMMGLITLGVLLVPFAGKLPISMQRSLTFLPLPNLDYQAVMDAEISTEWRLNMWSYLWPQVPKYLLLGKGYGLTRDDFNLMGGGSMVKLDEKFDPSSAGLAVSSDFHSGPFSTLIPLGLWGALAFLWLTLAGLRLLYRNYKYGEAELKTINTFLLASGIVHWLNFFFIYGAFQVDVGYFAGLFGLSVAFNGGMRGPASEPAAEHRLKSPPATLPT